MKKFMYFSLLSLVVVSCRTNEDSISTPQSSLPSKDSTLSKDDFAKITGSPQVSSDKFTNTFYLNNPFLTVTNESISRNINEDASKSSIVGGGGTATAVPTYTITVAVPSPSLTNQKIIYSGNGSQYPGPGVYYADIYNYFMKVQLPDDATGKIVSVQTPGYSNYNNATIGFNYSTILENGKTYLIANTYTMVLRYNAIGQAMQVVLPAASGAKTFTYKYIIF